MNPLRSTVQRRFVLGGAAGAMVSLHASSDTPQQKLSIYPNETPRWKVVDVPSELENQIRRARERATHSYLTAHAHLQMVIDRWIGVEQGIEARLKSLAPPPETEPIFPGVLYIGISTLFGSILARPRSLPIRILTPPSFAFAAMLYFLPNTSRNVGDYLWHVEKKYVPGVEKRQSTLVGHMGGMWRDAVAGVNEAKGGVGRGVDSALGWVQDNTGLKVKDVVQEEKKKSE